MSALIPRPQSALVDRDAMDIDALFERFFPGIAVEIEDMLPAQVAIDLVEQPERYVLTAAVPGFAPATLSVEAAGNHLVIRGHRRETGPGDMEREERFERAIALPGDADLRGAAATLRDGMLRVEVPKREDARRFTIHIRPEGTSRTPALGGWRRLLGAPRRLLRPRAA